MVKSAESHLYDVTQTMVENSTVTMQQELQSEISRLQTDPDSTHQWTNKEIKNLNAHQTALEEALAESRFRLDSSTWWLWRIEEVRVTGNSRESYVP